MQTEGRKDESVEMLKVFALFSYLLSITILQLSVHLISIHFLCTQKIVGCLYNSLTLAAFYVQAFKHGGNLTQTLMGSQ